MSTTPINSSGSTGAPAVANTPASKATDPLANQNVFLQLLVAQLKYQDPQNPADGTQFITQLAQFTEVSNTTQMASDIAAIKAALTAQPQTSSTSGSQSS